MSILSFASKLCLGLGVVALLATAGLSTGAFTTAELDRVAGVHLGEDEATLIGVDVTDEVSIACPERLVTVTSNFNDPATIVITILENRDGDPAPHEHAEGENPLQFPLSPGESTDVYITNVRGPPHDDVTFTITATSGDTSVTLTKHVPKVPGNEDEDDHHDWNRGGGGCGRSGGGPPWWDDDDHDDRG